MSRPSITLVAAMAEQRVIGVNNRLPWSLPEDLRHFKAVTLGKPVIMGRKTFDSIGRPLPGRQNIVVTRQADWRHAGVDPAHSLDQAIALVFGVPEVCVIGGADIYRQALPLADCLQLTEIELAVDGDSYFPEFSRDQWQEVGREPRVGQGGLSFAFVCYRRSAAVC